MLHHATQLPDKYCCKLHGRDIGQLTDI